MITNTNHICKIIVCLTSSWSQSHPILVIANVVGLLFQVTNYSKLEQSHKRRIAIKSKCLNGADKARHGYGT